MCMKKRLYMILAAGMLLGTSCSLQVRDAVSAGVFDFISGTVTQLLESLFPVAEAAAGA